MHSILCGGFALLAASLLAQEGRAADRSVVAIVDATVFDATGAAPRKATVIVKDGRIAEVGEDVRVPAGALIIRGEGKSLLPGLFDLHTHWNNSAGSVPKTAQLYVSSGVTSVNDFHQPPEAYEPRRRWVSQLTAPHITFTARMSTPGGHGADCGDQSTTKWVDTPDSARQAVRELLPYQPGAIKAFHDGWRYGQSQNNTSMDVETLAALADEAHQNGLKVLTHTVTVERGKDAARAKVDVIAHSLQDREVDTEAIRLIKDNGVFYGPTLAVYEPVKPGQPQPAARNEQAFRKFGYALLNVKALHEAGVPIVLATDSGMPGTPHGPATLRELELLVQAGLTPAEALIAGTATSARAMNVLADRGTIEAGKRADLILVDGAPWNNISDIRRIEQVLINGRPAYGPLASPTVEDARPRPLPIKAQALIDDFEGAPGRTSLDTLRIDATDGGRERSEQVTQVIAREGGGRALIVSARMARKPAPQGGVTFPLSRGGVEPVDATAFKGLRFEVRGDGGPITAVVTGAGGRWTAPVMGTAQWTTVELPFSQFQAAARRDGGTPSPLSGADLADVGFVGGRRSGDGLWLQIDNLAFY